MRNRLSTTSSSSSSVMSTLLIMTLLCIFVSTSFFSITVNAQKIYAHNELVNQQKQNLNQKFVNNHLAQNDMISNDRVVKDLNLLVTTLDGSIYSFRYSDGMLNWIVEQDSLFSTSQQISAQSSGTSTSLLIPSIDGTGEFFQYNDKSKSIQKLPYTLFDIVQSSPLIASSESGNADQKTLYVGSKITTVLVVDPESGSVLKTLTQSGTWEDGCPSVDLDYTDSTLLFTRSDYKVIALDPKSGEERWNLSMGEYMPFASHTTQDFTFDGSIEVHPLNNQKYKMWVKKQDVLSRNSVWSSMFVSPPVSIYAYSKTSGVLKKVDFTRKYADQQQIEMLPSPTTTGSTTGELVPSGWQPTYIFESYDGQIYITRDKSQENNLVINEGNQISDRENNQPNNSNNSNNNNSISSNSLYDLVETNQVKFGILLFMFGSIIFKLYSYIKKLKSRRSTTSSHPKKTPNKKKKKQQQHQNQQQQQQKNEEEEEIEETVESNVNLLKQMVDQAEETEKITITKRIELDNGNTRVGKIEMTTNVLGTGSCGTIVYEGFLEGRKVAIKRMLKQFIKFADREISLLLHSDEHMNVVRYHAKEEDSEFIYLALSYCKQSLDGLVDSKTLTDYKNIQVSQQMRRMILDLLSGLAHLHSLNIVHRDIKPQNILVDPNNRVKISDMGLGKKLDADSHSLTFTSDSYGWQPAEYLNGSNKNTKKVDIFSMGCVIYYLITGSNPFGGRFSREKNVLKGKFDIDPILHIPDLHNLILSMIQFDPDKRPTIEECKSHPFFWDTHKQMSFLVAASDYLEFEKPSDPLIIEFDSLTEVIGGSLPSGQNEWWAKLDQILIDNIGRYRKYNGKSLRDLMRVIRNKFNHYRDLPEDVQLCLGSIPDGFLQYFKQRFPKLIICTYLFIKKNLKNEAFFKQYFINEDDHHNSK